MSLNWDTVQAWTDATYMPGRVRPMWPHSRPRASMWRFPLGELTVSSFTYGVPVTVIGPTADTSNAVALTTVRGRATHYLDRGLQVDARRQLTFVGDGTCGVGHMIDLDEANLQLCLTIPHASLVEVALRWWDRDPGERLWRHKCLFGGESSTWRALLDYVVRTAPATAAHPSRDRVYAAMQELLLGQLLTEWATRAGIDASCERLAGPGYVRRAAYYIEANAKDLPTMTEVASEVGVSVRTLSGSFRRYLGVTPSEYLRVQRLEGARRDLIAADEGRTVATIAGEWGYVNLGGFAAAYRRRFGEKPSQTLSGSR
ncbi:AraC family transcriptional regulator [Nocardia tengchongensis]